MVVVAKAAAAAAVVPPGELEGEKVARAEAVAREEGEAGAWAASTYRSTRCNCIQPIAAVCSQGEGACRDMFYL